MLGSKVSLVEDGLSRGVEQVQLHLCVHVACVGNVDHLHAEVNPNGLVHQHGNHEHVMREQAAG